MLEEAVKSESAAVAKTAELDLIKLAEGGDMACAEILTSVYSDGTPCIPQDADKAYKYTETLAKNGFSFYQYWLARLQYDAGKRADALASALKAYEQGSDQGGELAAKMLIEGEGEGATHRAADGITILEKLIADSSMEARIALATYLLDGNFVKKDIPRAYELAASVPASVYKARLHAVGAEKASDGYYVLGYATYLMHQNGKAVGEWDTWLKKAAEMGHRGAQQLLDKSGGADTGMRNTVQGNLEVTEVSPGVFDISYMKYRTIFLAMFVTGIVFTGMIVFAALGIPLLIIGAIGTFGFKQQGKLTIVKNVGIKFTTGFVNHEIPFKEISRVSWDKILFSWFSCRVTVDTKGKTVIVAKNVPHAVALDLQEAIVNF